MIVSSVPIKTAVNMPQYILEATPSDYAMLLGAQDQYSTSYYASGLKLMRNHGLTYAAGGGVSDRGHVCSINLDDRRNGIRPTMKFSDLSKLASVARRNEKGIIEITYGEYPQSIADEKLQRELNEALMAKKLRQTGKGYVYNVTGLTSEDDDLFSANPEYEYKGKRYIKVYPPAMNSYLYDDSFKDGVWVSVDPIVWLVDEANNIALTKNILISGIRCKRANEKISDYDEQDNPIYNFLNNYFVREFSNGEALKNGSQTKIIIEKPVGATSYNLDFGEVSEEDIIEIAINSKVPVFLHGAPGVGKSARVKQIDSDCIRVYLRNTTPESLNGISVRDKDSGEMIDIPPTWYKKLKAKCEQEPDKTHVLFLDEISNALPSIQGMAFNIVLDREVNGIWKLPENCVTIAAGNDIEDSLAANEIAEPLFDRFAHVYIKSNVDKWLRWASNNDIHPAVYTFIAYKREKALRTPYNGATPNADERKWEMVSDLLYKCKNPNLARGLIGENLCREFSEFCKQKIISVEDVLTGNYKRDDLNMDMAKKYITVAALARASESDVETIRSFVANLGNEFVSLFDTLWSKGDENRVLKIAEIKSSKR